LQKTVSRLSSCIDPFFFNVIYLLSSLMGGGESLFQQRREVLRGESSSNLVWIDPLFMAMALVVLAVTVPAHSSRLGPGPLLLLVVLVLLLFLAFLGSHNGSFLGVFPVLFLQGSPVFATGLQCTRALLS
jgi:hypothetical protein